MKAFQFRLGSLVRIREMQLRREESTLEQLFAQKARIQSDLESLQQLLTESWNASKNRRTLLSSDLSAMSAVEEQFRREEPRSRIRLIAQEELISKQQSVVVEIRRNLRLLEKLELKRRQEWQIEADRELAALVDDMTNARRHKKSCSIDS
jgi:non-ribosomal peptide synthetase component F